MAFSSRPALCAPERPKITGAILRLVITNRTDLHLIGGGGEAPLPLAGQGLGRVESALKATWRGMLRSDLPLDVVLSRNSYLENCILIHRQDNYRGLFAKGVCGKPRSLDGYSPMLRTMRLASRKKNLSWFQLSYWFKVRKLPHTSNLVSLCRLLLPAWSVPR